MIIVGEAIAEVSLPVFPVTNVQTTADTMRLVDGSHWVEVKKTITITAAVALPNSEIMLMIEKIVSGNQPVDDIRRTVLIQDGQLQLQFTPKVSGNYLISAARLNAGLAQKGKEYRLAFDDVEFEVYDPA